MNKDMFKNKWLKLDIEEIDKIWEIKIPLELLNLAIESLKIQGNQLFG